jgi:hypothetical protein
MSRFTFTQISASLQSWRDDTNAEFVAAIPDIVSMAELRILRDMNLTIFDQTRELTGDAGDRELGKPEGWFVTRSLWRKTENGTARTFMQMRSLSYCYDFAPDSSVTDAPTQFAELSDELWYVVATPDAVYKFDAYVGIRPTPMGPSNDDSWVGTELGDLLHAAALAGAIKYLKKPIEKVSHEQDYQALLATARLEMRSLIRSDYDPTRGATRGI